MIMVIPPSGSVESLQLSFASDSFFKHLGRQMEGRKRRTARAYPTTFFTTKEDSSKELFLLGMDGRPIMLEEF